MTVNVDIKMNRAAVRDMVLDELAAAQAAAPNTATAHTSFPTAPSCCTSRSKATSSPPPPTPPTAFGKCGHGTTTHSPCMTSSPLTTH